MRGRSFCLLSLLTLLALSSDGAARGSTNGKLLRFDLYRDYLIVARGSAGSQKELNFLLDTGASPTVVDRRLARRLDLQELPSILAGINGRVQARLATVPSLQVGPILRTNLPVVVEDLSFFSKALPVRIDAVIGLDVVGQGPFEIDYAGGKIMFGPTPPLRNRLPLEMKAGLPLVMVELDHLSARLVLDTGASSLILFEAKGPALISRAKVEDVQQASSMIGEFDRKQVVLGSLRLGQAELRRQPAFLVQSRPDGTENFDGLMSPALLGMRKLAIDLERGVMEFNR